MEFKKILQKGINLFNAHRKRVLIGTGVLAVFLVAVVVLPMLTNQTPDGNVQYAQVSRGSLTESIGEVGFVKAEPSAALVWKSAGIVADYAVAVGTQVEKDQVLMELEFSSWPNAALEAQADLLDAQLALDNLINADTDLQTALLAVTTAEWNMRNKKEQRDAWNWAQSSDERIDTVRKAYLNAVRLYWVAEQEYETLRLMADEGAKDLVYAYEALQEADLARNKLLRALNQILGNSYNLNVETDFIEYDQAVDELAIARQEYERQLNSNQIIAAAEAKVQALQNTINTARIIAPFDGVVTYIAYLPGENAASGEIAIQIDDLNNLVVNTTVSEVDIAKVAIGQPVVVSFDAIPYKEYSGIVTRIAAAGSDSSGTVTFSVTVAVSNPDGSIKPGFSADISIITGQAEDALLVPNEALLGQNGNYRVMVVREGQDVAPVPVEIGARSDTHTEIIGADIQEGDQVIVMANMSGNQLGGGGFGMMGGMRQITGGGSRPPDNGN